MQDASLAGNAYKNVLDQDLYVCFRGITHFVTFAELVRETSIYTLCIFYE